MYRIKFTEKAKKGLKKLKLNYRQAISEILEEIKENPYISKPLTKKLVGKYAYKLGPYRLIYVINNQDQIINIIIIGHRSTIYK